MNIFRVRKVFVMGLVALAVLAVVLPVLSTITTVNSRSRGGRVFRYTAIMTAEKDPADDPWTGDSWRMFVHSGSAGSPGWKYLQTSAGSFSSSSVLLVSALAPGPEPWIRYIRFINSFSFATTTTAEIRLRWNYGSGEDFILMYIPSRTYSAGVTYRWVIQINMYNTSTLRVMPFVPNNNNRLYRFVPLSVYCAYTGGGSMTGLSLSYYGTSHNLTHIRWTVSITFSGSEWNDRYVTSCVVYTTDSHVINTINSMFQSAISQLWLLYVEPRTTVLQGDILVVEVWVVAPPNV